MDDSGLNGMLGMSEEDLYAFLNEILHDEAAEAAAESGKTVEEELDTREFTAVAASNTYAIKLIMANNAYLTRQLIDRGVLPTGEE